MSNLIVFLDEKSAICSELSKDVAAKKVKSLISVIRSVKKINSNISVNTENALRDVSICPNWTIGAVFGGDEFKDEWAFLRFLQNRSPLSHDVGDLADILVETDCVINSNGVASTAVQLANILDSAILSFDGEIPWNSSLIEATHSVIDDIDGSVNETQIVVRNASSLEHVGSHSVWLEDVLSGLANSNELLWANRAIIFDRLILLPAIENHLTLLCYGTIPYFAAVNALKRLNNAARSWTDPDKSPAFETKTTPESASRMKLCNFWDETSGREENFSWHSRFTGGLPGRIHFRMDKQSLTVIVAYIGSKLE